MLYDKKKISQNLNEHLIVRHFDFPHSFHESLDNQAENA